MMGIPCNRCGRRHDPDDHDEMDGCPAVQQTCVACPATGPRYMFEDSGLCVSCELARDRGLDVTCRATGEEG